MPPLTRWFVKTSLIYLVVALVFALVLASNRVLNLPPLFQTLGPVYLHLFLVGWVTQLIFGVVYWMFPKYSMEKPRGNENLAWATLWLLNFGLVLRVVGEPAQALSPSSSSGWLLAASALLQWLAGMLFIFNTWGRVKER